MKKDARRRLCRTGHLFGDPKENRTPDSALRGRRLDRLTIGPRLAASAIVCSGGNYIMAARAVQDPSGPPAAPSYPARFKIRQKKRPMFEDRPANQMANMKSFRELCGAWHQKKACIWYNQLL